MQTEVEKDELHAKEIEEKDLRIQDLTIKLINSENTNNQLIQLIKDQEQQSLILVGKIAKELLKDR